MRNPKPISACFCIILLVSILSNVGVVIPKSTIEPCSDRNSCYALVGYTLYDDLEVAEVAELFQIDPFALLAANNINLYEADILQYILPSGVFLLVPLLCWCPSGIRKSPVTYVSKPSDTLNTISNSVYGRLLTAEQLSTENNISGDGSTIAANTSLTVPLPCTCFGQKVNSLPAIYLSYVVREGETLKRIAAKYATSLTTISRVNGLQSTDVSSGDILAVPLAACASNFVKYASDYDLVAANNSYVITADHCVQCSCMSSNFILTCKPTLLPVSCTSMQCKNSNLGLGNVTTVRRNGGCQVTSCSYNGFVNKTIWMTLSNSLQAACPGTQHFPQLVEPTSLHPLAPTKAPTPSEIHTDTAPVEAPRPSKVPSAQPSPRSDRSPNAPAGSFSGGFSAACSLTPWQSLPITVLAVYSMPLFF